MHGAASVATGGHRYRVYLPAGHRSRTRYPVLVPLHGCRQNAEDFVAATRFAALADRHGIVLVAPEQSALHHPNRCWQWYREAHQQRDRGEPAAVAGITRVVLAEPVRWTVDPARVFVAGISAGGALALILGATYPDVFAAVGVHSAPAYASASGSGDALA